LSSGVVELPVEVSLAGEEGAGVAAAHGDDDVTGLDRLGGEDLGFLVGEINSFLAHRFDDSRVDGIPRGRARGADLDRVSSEVAQVAGSHLGAAGVVDTDKQYAGFGHGAFLLLGRTVIVKWGR